MTTDSPGVYVPPPLLYVIVFLASLLLQHFFPLHFGMGLGRWTEIPGLLLIALALLFMAPSLLQFIRTRNSLIPFKPARSLQTDRIYAITRNPMYFGLLLAYLGICVFAGNWWTLLLVPALILLVQKTVIIKEEKYLQRAFGAEYEAYRSRVRRWI